MKKRIIFFLFVLAGVSNEVFSQSWELVVRAYVENNGFFNECTDPRTYYGIAYFGTSSLTYYEASESSPSYATFTFTGTGAPPTTGVSITTLIQACTHDGTRNYDGPSPYIVFPVDVSNCNGNAGAGVYSDYNTIPPSGSSFIRWEYTFTYLTTLTAPGGNSCGDDDITLAGTPGFSSYDWQFRASTSPWWQWESFATTSGPGLTFSKQNHAAIPYGEPVFFRYKVLTTCVEDTVSGSYTFFPPPPLIDSISTTAPQCRDGKGGTITVHHASSSMVEDQSYTYTIVQLVEAADCSEDEEEPISLPEEIEGLDGYCPLYVTNATNGSGALSFKIDTTNTTVETIKFIPGKYLIMVEASSVTGGISCFTYGIATIVNPPAVTATLALRTPPTCIGGNDGTATFTINNGVGPFTWKIRTRPTAPALAADFFIPTSPSSSRTILATNLPAEKYTFVIVSDKCGDTYSLDFEILASTTSLALNFPAPPNPPTCYTSGVGNGSFTINTNQVGSYTSGYTFRLFNNDDLSAGELTSVPKTMNNNRSVTYSSLNHDVDYKVEVTSPNGCIATEIITLDAPLPINGTAVPTNNTCHGGTSGEILFNQSEGSANLSYGLEKQNASSVYQPFAATLNATNKRYTGLPAGVYRLTVTDNCLTTSGVAFTIPLPEVPITEPNALEFVTTPGRILNGDEYSINCVDSTKDLTLEFRFGTPPYTATLVRNSTPPVPLGNGPSISLSLGIGDYSVTVTDGCGYAPDPLEFSITSLATLPLTATITKFDLTCPERDDGSLQVDITGGIPGVAANPYIVELLDDQEDPVPATITNTNNSYLISGLAEAIAYKVRVKDYNSTPNPPGGCIKHFDRDLNADDLSIYTPEPLNIEPLDKNTDFSGLALFEDELYVICKGDQNGKATATVTGGNPNYVVKLFRRDTVTNPWPSEPIQQRTNVVPGPVEFAGLGFGDYKLEVADLETCQSTARTFLIKEADSRLQIEEVSPLVYPHLAHTSCYGYSDGEITLRASGGVGDYTYQLKNNDGYDSLLSKSGNEQIFRELPAINAMGDTLQYIVSLRDAIGCPWKWENEVDSIIFLNPPDTVEFSWKIGSRMVPGFEIPCHGDEALIYVWSEGGKYPHEVLIGGETEIISSQSDTVEFNLSAGTHSVVLEDQLECPAPVQVIELEEPASHVQVVPGMLIPPVCIGGTDGQIHISAEDGVPSAMPGEQYSFVLKRESDLNFDTDTLRGPSVVFQRPANFYEPQQYTLRVIDRFLCTSDAVVTLQRNPDPLSVSFDTLASPSCYGGTDGFITVRSSNHDFIDGTSLIFMLSGGHFGDSIAAVSVDSDVYTFLNLQGTDLEQRDPYRSWIVDANSCLDTAFQYNDTLRLRSYAPVALNLIEMIRPTCYNGSDGSLYMQVTGGVPPYRYSMDSVNFTDVGTDSLIFEKDLVMGDFTFFVRDVQYNPDQEACQMLDTLTVAAGRFIRVESDQQAVSCKDGSDGSVVLRTYVDHRPVWEPYDSSLVEVYWTHDDVSSLPIGSDTAIYNIPKGTFTAHVSYDADSVTCTTERSFVVQEPASRFSISDIVTYEASCGTYSDGIAVVSVIGGWPDSLSYFRVDEGPWQLFTGLSFVLTGLSPEDHTIEIGQTHFENEFLCLDAKTFSIASEKLTLAVSGVFFPSCPMASDGAIVLDAEGANPLYAFEGSEDDLQLLNVFENLTAGTYRFVAQKNGDPTCRSNVVEVSVEDPEDCGDGPLTAMELSSIPSTCAASSDGRAIVRAEGGVPPYKYFWDGSIEEGSNSKTGLSLGLHQVIVTDLTGSSSVVDILIDTLPKMELDHDVLQPLCATTPNGSLGVRVRGGSGDFSIEWQHDPENTNFSLSGLSAGEYYYTVSDDLHDACYVEGSYLLEHLPSLNIELVSAVAPTCPEGTDGYLVVDVTGGSGSYEMLWANGATLDGETTERIEGYVPGDYTLLVTDRYLGCSTDGVFTLPDADPIEVIQTLVSAPLCHGYKDGQAELVLDNTQSPLIRWNNGQIGKKATGLKTGTYTYSIISASGCQINGVAEIPDRLPLLADQVSTPVTCYGTCDGTIQLTPQGGTTPYFVTWAHGPRLIALQNLCSGSYSYKVTDKHNCQTIGEVPVLSPGELVLALEKSDPLCYASEDGEVSVTAEGGIEPYEYKWSNGSELAELTGLDAGEYSVTVQDANACNAVVSIVLDDPDPLLVQNTKIQPPSCPQSEDGIISLDAAGGTAPYTYTWENGSTGKELVNLKAGTYALVLGDAHGCAFSKSFDLAAPEPLAIANVEEVDPHCFGESNGSISIQVIGGAKPFDFVWSNGSSTTMVENLTSGEYGLTVTDSKKCTLEQTFTLVNPALPLIDGIPSTIVICSGGVAAAEPNGDWSAYKWTGPDNFLLETRRFESKVEGAYTLTSLDDRGCPATFDFEVDMSPNALIADFLRISEAVAFEPIVFIDISQPVPTLVDWIVPDDPDVSVTKKNAAALEIIFTATGTYEIGMKAALDNCVSELYKTIVVTEPDPDGGDPGGRIGSIAEPELEITLYPNPASENLEISIHSPVRDAIGLRLITGIDNRTIVSDHVAGYLDYLIEWDITQARAGVYYLVYEQNGKIATKRIIVIK